LLVLCYVTLCMLASVTVSAKLSNKHSTPEEGNASRALSSGNVLLRVYC